MKKLSVLFLSVVALATTVVSCSKDEAPSIVAKWNYTTITHTTSASTTAPERLTSESCTDQSYLDLRSGGVVEQQIVGNSADPCAVSNATGTYTYENNILHLASGNGSINYTVVSVSSNKLIVKSINPNDTNEYLTITLVK